MRNLGEKRGGSLVRRARFGLAAVSVGVVAIATACGPPPLPTSPLPNPLSRGTNGVLGNGHAEIASMSANGNVVAFSSSATNLVPGDTNGLPDLFLRDLVSGQVTKITEYGPASLVVEPGGGAVAWSSGSQIGHYNRSTNSVSTWSSGADQGLVVAAADGTVVYGGASVFGLLSANCRVRVVTTGSDMSCPVPGGLAPEAEVLSASSNARHVLYRVTGSTSDGVRLWDRVTGGVTAVPMAAIGSDTAVSDDGARIAVRELVSGVMTVVVHDLRTGSEYVLPQAPDSQATIVVGISPDGSRLLFATDATNLDPTDSNEAPDVYAWTISSGSVDRVSGLLSGGSATPNGAGPCGYGPGQLLNDGRSCVRSQDPLVPSDTNSSRDAYRVS